MLKTARKFAPAIITLALSGAYPFAHAESSGGGNTQSGPATMNGASMSSGASGAANAGTASDDKAVQGLLAASQSLREGVQKLAQAPAGEQRTEAIRESNDALMQVQSAIAALPPHLLTANADEASYQAAMDKLRQASDRLYTAANALASQPDGQQRNEAIKGINQALMEINEAMLDTIQLSPAGGAVTSGSSSAEETGGAVGSAAVTGRPGANSVDLSEGATPSSGNNTGPVESNAGSSGGGSSK